MAKKKITIGRSMLETITVALYENPIILFREYVQNSLDAHNMAVDKKGAPVISNLEVTITVDDINRTIVIMDNGYGIPSDTLFEKEMLSIGSSNKQEDKTKYIGFRGIGRISGLPFCEKLTFRNKAPNSTTVNECTCKGEA